MKGGQLLQGLQSIVIKHFSSEIDAGKLLHPSPIFEGKARAYPSGATLGGHLPSPSNIMLGYIGLPGTNTLVIS